jgi:hypothetical protein
MIDTSVIRSRFTAVERDLSERSRRLLAAAEAKTAGFGGITATSLATGMARSTIGRGLKDLAAPDTLAGEVRRPGGGGPTLIDMTQRCWNTYAIWWNQRRWAIRCAH